MSAVSFPNREAVGLVLAYLKEDDELVSEIAARYGLKRRTARPLLRPDGARRLRPRRLGVVCGAPMEPRALAGGGDVSAMRHRERTAWHEAGHAVVGREIGWNIERIELTDGGGGACYASASGPTSLGDQLAQLLAGRLSVALADEVAEREALRWWEVSAVNTLELERGMSPGRGTGRRHRDWVQCVARERRLTLLAAETALADELRDATRKAVGILRKRWSEVAALAAELLERGAIDLGAALGSPGVRSRARAEAATPSLADLRRKSREAVNEARRAAGLPPKPKPLPVIARRLAADDPIVVGLKARAKGGPSTQYPRNEIRQRT
jgi:hypothetical protein